MSDNFPKARLIELFSAIQGEGLNVGTRQIFIRFAICDLRCQYCDSAHTWQTPPTCKIEQTPGKRDFLNYPNPIELTSLLSWVEKQNQPALHDSISLTGGEPLLHANFLFQFLPEVRKITGLPIYLETGGHRPEELAMVLPYLDSVGMDIKLPSVSGENYWSAHQEFLKLCHDANVETFVKLIVSSQTNPKELELAGELVANCDPKIPIFLQPVTPIPNQPTILAPAPDLVLEWQGLMKRFVKQVRVIPQTHKMIGQL
ncbi:7-carboxy-7-deazaguanine synthase QueE [Aerosakkonemataceae cyanobacterium BLCC-F154]|uniref:7-carboxy-7-deazaguanine synthase n=1 Tax=Floridaenema fluviatile BLCC-F154 TaxID=3153640 RepID=A0ABV4Y705_9CYAN